MLYALCSMLYALCTLLFVARYLLRNALFLKKWATHLAPRLKCIEVEQNLTAKDQQTLALSKFFYEEVEQNMSSQGRVLLSILRLFGYTALNRMEEGWFKQQTILKEF